MNEETIVRKQKQQYLLPLEDRIAYSVLEASQLVGVSYTTLWRAIRRGDLHPIKGMGLMRISKKELQRFTEDTWDIHPKRTRNTCNWTWSAWQTHCRDCFLGILQAIDTSAAELARKLAVPTNRVTAILNGRRASPAIPLGACQLLRNECGILAESSDPPADKKLPLTENNFMPTPYAYTQWCFFRENVKRHEVTRRAISLGGLAIAHHWKMAKKPLEVLIIPWS
jgi:excisionase family DNA binding protein